MKGESNTFNIVPMSGGCGAEVSGLNLSEPMDKSEKELLEKAWLEYQVLFFRDQPLTPEQHVNFAKNFGELQGPGYMPTLEDYPNVYVQEYPDLFKGIVSDVDWHIDASFLEKPLKGAVLYAIDVPKTGGDTTWVNLYEAYDSLSESMKELCSNLTAVHDNFHKNLLSVIETYGSKGYEMARKATPPREHPLVCTHPQTGKKCLFYSELMVSHFKELSTAESQYLKGFLIDHIKKPELACRFKWENDSVAFWDNRCTAHRGIFDFGDTHRLMHRVAIQGESKPS